MKKMAARIMQDRGIMRELLELQMFLSSPTTESETENRMAL